MSAKAQWPASPTAPLLPDAAAAAERKRRAHPASGPVTVSGFGLQQVQVAADILLIAGLGATLALTVAAGGLPVDCGIYLRALALTLG